MALTNILFAFVLLSSFALFGFSARRLLSYLQTARPENRFDNLTERAKRVVKIALLQTKLVREPVAGIMHLAIFWGFMVLVVAVLESIGEGIAGHFSFRFLGRIYSLITFSQEIFCLLVAAAIAMALWARPSSSGSATAVPSAVPLVMAMARLVSSGTAMRTA